MADDTPNPTNMAKRGFWSVWDYLVKKGGADWLVPLLITTGGLGAILGVAKANWPLIIACAVLGLGFVCLVVISMRAVRPSTEAILKLTAAQATPPSWTDRPQRPSPSDRGCRIGAMLSLNRTALVCAVLLVVAGCTQKTNSPTRDAGRDVVVTPHDSGEDVASPHDAGRDVAPPHDSGRDVASPRDAGRDVVLHHDAGRDVVLPHDAGPVDATHDAAPRDAAIVCAYPIGPNQCTSDAATACRRTWAQVLATPPACGPFVYEYESRGTCGAYYEAEFVGLTQKGMYYYDATTGQLAAVYTVTGTMTPSCYEGPPGGIPTCDLPAADNKCLRDAGTSGRG